MGHLQAIYNILRSGGLTEAATLAMMGNWQCESGLEAGRLQGDFSPYRTPSKNYVERATNGSMTKEEFKKSIGFGLAQWTLPLRKDNFWEFWKKSGAAIDNPSMQTRFCLWELLNMPEFTSLLSTLRRGTDLYECTKLICTQYERPEVPNIDDRFRAAQELKTRINLNDDSIQNGSNSGKGEMCMTDAQAIQKVLDLARSELGYHEKASNMNLDSKTANSGSGNFTKYARDLDQTSAFYNGPKNGYAWCDVFIDWLFVKSFGAETGREMLCQPHNSAGAGCLYSAQYYKSAGRWSNSPKVGDQIFFTYSPGEYSHTGIVEAVSGGTVTTIEGNTSDQVGRRNYSVGSGNIAGYGRPKWELVNSIADSGSESISFDDSATINPYTAPILRRGSTGQYVIDLQNSLKKLGYDIGQCGADGDFGTDTYNAVVKFQEDHGLLKDGEVGPDTYEAIANALLDLARKDGAKNTDVNINSFFPDEQTVVIGKPAENTQKVYLEIGDIVEFTGDTCYISYANDTMPAKCKAGRALIINVSKTGKHAYQLCKINGFGSTVYGWVNEEEVQKVS